MVAGETGTMNRTEGPKYPRPCPICATAMVGERAGPDSPEYVRLACLNCGTTIEIGKPAPSGDPDEPSEP